jgi:hypothetical protein
MKDKINKYLTNKLNNYKKIVKWLYLKKFILIVHNNYINYINLCNNIQINYTLLMEILINYHLLMNHVNKLKLNYILI